MSHSSLHIVRKLPGFMLDGMSRMVRYTRIYGFRYAARKARSSFARRLGKEGALLPPERCALNQSERLNQERHVFPNPVTFSVVVPLYNTPLNLLNEMIASVRAQTYPHWELCLADGSGEPLEAAVLEAAAGDARVKYRRLANNGGISANTNACIDFASGDFIALLDHDDLLHEAALYRFAQRIAQTGADLVYSDEAVFSDTPADARYVHYKPDYSPELLLCNNYICHFTAYRRALLKDVGPYRSECDGSQDFDMMLRITEHTSRVEHVPEVLYFWRCHEGSVAMSIAEKPYVVEAARRAAESRLSRTGVPGEVRAFRGDAIMRIFLKPPDARVSILLACGGEGEPPDAAAFTKYPRAGVYAWNPATPPPAEALAAEFLLFLDARLVPQDDGWLEHMLGFFRIAGVGAVGGKLLRPDGSIWDAGIGIALMTGIGHFHRWRTGDDIGYAGRLVCAGNVSAVSSACMLVKTDAYRAAGGFSPEFQGDLRDADFGLMLHARGFRTVFTPEATLQYRRGTRLRVDHHARSAIARFREKWKDVADAGDPYYNLNLRTDSEWFDGRV